jgi:hypothetical protein
MNEGLVRRLWLSGGWPAGLPRAVDGTAPQIVYAGRAGSGAGPDLLDAIVALPDGRLLRGDVEIHNRASEWFGHGHHEDPRYARVVLHVVWRDDVGRPVTRAPAVDQPGLLTVALRDQPERLLFERLTAVPDDPRYHDWLRTLPAAERGALLDRLADERLAAKAARIGADLHELGPEEALHRALADALGYSQNRRPFGRLAELLPAAELGAIARGRRYEDDAECDVLAALLDAAWQRMAPGEWELVGVRPANRPARRMAALARLVVRHRRHGLVAAVEDALATPESRLAASRLHGLVRVGSSPEPRAVKTIVPDNDPRTVGYWLSHHAVGRALPGGAVALLGDARASEIVANVLLPFALALADARADDGLDAAARAAWAAAPAGSGNWILAEMRPLLVGLPLGRARREQGAIELYRRCCEERRCLTCPRGQDVAAGRATARA